MPPCSAIYLLILLTFILATNTAIVAAIFTVRFTVSANTDIAVGFIATVTATLNVIPTITANDVTSVTITPTLAISATVTINITVVLLLLLRF